MTQRYYTDYPIEQLGDAPGREAPIREIEVLSYDGDKYVVIRIGDLVQSIKAGYVYSKPGRCQHVPTISRAALDALPETEL